MLRNFQDKNVVGYPSRIVMVGTFPPPVHGMAAVNKAVYLRLQAAGSEPLVIDLGAPSLNRALWIRLGRIPRVLRGLVRLVCTRQLQDRVLYMSVSGGFGQIYELLFLVLARMRAMRIFLHHHSFVYLDAPSQLTKLLTRLAGAKAVHITQSPKMAEKLKTIYRLMHVISVSNAVFLVSSSVSPSPSIREEVKVLGYLSNISAKKGVFEFLDILEVARDRCLPVRGILAGPFQDSETEQQVRKRLAALPNVAYVGPKYGTAKDQFFLDIDVLVFPTLYKNETEGIVNHEAMQNGVPVIAYGRGCIPEIVVSECGLVVPPGKEFVPLALDQIQAWLAEPALFRAVSIAAAARFAALHTVNVQYWESLVTQLLVDSLNPAAPRVQNRLPHR
jgi:glycosyltransferase involved in cell wall biosynthesis